MVSTPAKPTVSCAFGPRLRPASPLSVVLGGALTQKPWRSQTPGIASSSPSPPRFKVPPPTRQPPPIPDIRPPDMAVTEIFPEPELPLSVLEHLIASIRDGEDINNLKQTFKSRSAGLDTDTQASQLEADHLFEHCPPPPSLQKYNVQHSHHSSKNSAGHSYAFGGGRSHKASLTSTGSVSSRRMTTEEKMSEVDQFFGLDDVDDDGGPVVTTAPVAGSYIAGGASVDPLMEVSKG